MVKAIQFEAGAETEPTNRAFLQRAEAASQLPRDVKKQFPSPNPPAWAYIPDKRNSSAVETVQDISLPTAVVAFDIGEMSDGQIPPPKEIILPEWRIISVRDEPDKTIPPIPPDPDFSRLSRPLPKFFEYATKVYTSRQLGISIAELEVKIANGEIVIESGEIAVMRLGDWIESVGGVGRAQALVEELGWPDSVSIDSVIIRSTFKAEPPPPPNVPVRSEPTIDDLPAIEASGDETPEDDSSE